MAGGGGGRRAPSESRRESRRGPLSKTTDPVGEPQPRSSLKPVRRQEPSGAPSG